MAEDKARGHWPSCGAFMRCRASRDIPERWRNRAPLCRRSLSDQLSPSCGGALRQPNMTYHRTIRREAYDDVPNTNGLKACISHVQAQRTLNAVAPIDRD